LNISLAGLGMWDGTMDRNNKKRQNSKVVAKLSESTIATKKKVVKLRV
jgi:hypothetical protein